MQQEYVTDMISMNIASKYKSNHYLYGQLLNLTAIIPSASVVALRVSQPQLTQGEDDKRETENDCNTHLLWGVVSGPVRLGKTVEAG